MVTTVVIYYFPKRGSDKHGTGSRKKPFKTVQRAIRAVPMAPKGGAAYVIARTDSRRSK